MNGIGWITVAEAARLCGTDGLTDGGSPRDFKVLYP